MLSIFSQNFYRLNAQRMFQVVLFSIHIFKITHLYNSADFFNFVWEKLHNFTSFTDFFRDF